MSKRTRKILWHGILSALALAASSSPSWATLLSYSVSTGFASTPFSAGTNLSVPQFNTPSSTLNSVSVTLNGNIAGSIQVANTGTFVPVTTQPAAPTVGTPVSISGRTGNNSKSITQIASTANLFVGEKLAPIAGVIPANTTITSIDSATQIHISNNATATGVRALALSCAGLTTCSVWNLGFHAAPPASIPNNTVDSSIAATVTLHIGSDLVVNLANSVSDTLDQGPQYDPDNFNFTKTYSGAPITQAVAQGLAPNASGVTPLGGIPAPVGTANPCFAIYGACLVGGDTYNVGASHLGLSSTGTDSLFFTNPLDLAPFIGTGFVILPVDAIGSSSHTDLSGNLSFLSYIQAEADATVTYDYTVQSNGRTGVPEPGSLALLGSGLVALTALRRRKRKDLGA